ncbi:MAG: hypothetical protein ABGX74_08170, partial [Psychrobacter sp.]
IVSRSKNAKLCKRHVIDVAALYHKTGTCLYEVLSAKIGRRVFWQSEIKKTTERQSLYQANNGMLGKNMRKLVL